MTRIKCVQQNLQRSEVAHYNLIGRLNELDVYIAFLQEPYKRKGKLVNLPRDAVTYPSPTVVESPRVAIIASKSLRILEVPSLSTVDAVVAVFRLHGKDYLLASLYFDINKEVIQSTFLQISKFANDNGMPLIIAADTNSHSTIFGPTQNTRGDSLEDFLASENLTVHNNSLVPTFRTVRASSCIDVTLSRDTADLIGDWQANSDYNGSDHSTITFSLSLSPGPPELVRAWDRTNWALFKQLLEKDTFYLPAKVDQRKIDKAVGKLYSRLNRALDQACPLHEVPTSGRKSNVWYDGKLDRLRENTAKLYKKKLRKRDENSKKEYEAAARKYKYACRKKKKAAWRHYMENLDSPKACAQFLNTLKGEPRCQVSTFQRGDGSMTLPGKDSVDALIERHFPAANHNSYCSYDLNKREDLADIEKSSEDWISVEKVKAALEGFCKKKSPGPDGLKPIIFHHIPPNVLEHITSLYRCCVSLAYTPRLWKALSPN